MNSKHVTTLLAAVSSLAAFSPTGCAKEKAASAPVPVADRTPAAPLVKEPTQSSAVPAPAPVRWEDIAECGYDQRPQFLAGMKKVELQVDAQIAELNARRVIMQRDNTNTNAWDFSMKEMQDSRSYLKSMDDELGKAPREFWNQTKDKVRQAWERTQKAYKAVRASTTN